MATSNCNQNCGCSNSYTVTAPCPPSCTEVFNAQCIVYTGTNIVCGNDTVISRYDYMDTVITKIINYFCNRLANVPITVVESDSEYILVSSSTVGNQTTYVLDLDFAQLQADLNLTLPVYNVVGSDNVFVSTSVVGNLTTFTLSALESEVINADGLLNVTANITPGIDVIYTVNVDLPALAAALPQTSVIQGPSGNTLITSTVVGNLTTYSVDSLETIVAAGNNTTVTASGGGAPNYDTTYTVDAELSTLALLLGEPYLTLTSVYTPGTNTTAYTLSTNDTALNTFINTEINDVLDNTVGGFGIDAVYNNGTQTLTLNFDGASVAVGGGITGNGTIASPFAVDPSVVARRYEDLLNIAGTATITHNLNSFSIVVSVVSAGGLPPYNVFQYGVDYTYTLTSNNTILVTDLVGMGTIRVTVIG